MILGSNSPRLRCQRAQIGEIMSDLLSSARESTYATLTRKEVAELLRVDPRTVSEGIRSGTIPSIRLGRRVLIPREPLLAMVTASGRSEDKR